MGLRWACKKTGGEAGVCMDGGDSGQGWVPCEQGQHR